MYLVWNWVVSCHAWVIYWLGDRFMKTLEIDDIRYTDVTSSGKIVYLIWNWVVSCHAWVIYWLGDGFMKTLEIDDIR